MVELLEQLTVGQGVLPSALPGVRLMRCARDVPRTPVIYEPNIVFVVQGRKRGFLGGRMLQYDPDHHLILTVPMPFECETLTAGPGKPMLGVKVAVDPGVLGELLTQTGGVGGRGGGNGSAGLGFGSPANAAFAAPTDPRLGDAVLRLLECLARPDETAVLGPLVVREIVFRVLCGEHGAALRALAAANGQLARIAAVLRRLHLNYADPVDVRSLAQEAAMSPSAFHQHFRDVTHASPLQYLKSIRLHRARHLMTHDGHGAAEAAGHVGYESASQFSREFKRFFGRPPAAEAAALRHQLGLETD